MQLRAREAVRAAVEEALDLPLLIEFTGLVSWRPGSTIGWHHDACRPYLAQRSHSAVCYLNAADNDFAGGTFRFNDGVPEAVQPAAGRLVSCWPAEIPCSWGPSPTIHPPRVQVAYSAQDVHCIEPVAAGERFTLTLWFTEDPQHCEDTRLLAQLAGGSGSVQQAPRAPPLQAAQHPAPMPPSLQGTRGRSLVSLPQCGACQMGPTCASAAWAWQAWPWCGEARCCAGPMRWHQPRRAMAPCQHPSGSR